MQSPPAAASKESRSSGEVLTAQRLAQRDRAAEPPRAFIASIDENAIDDAPFGNAGRA